ncbi:hypothetical protein BH11PLA2_BH11PLA2_13890 [soil metagenome]
MSRNSKKTKADEGWEVVPDVTASMPPEATVTLPPKSHSMTSTQTHTPDGKAPGNPAKAAITGTKRYQLGAEIARGGMGIVYRAVDTAISREVALKVLHERYATKSAAAKRFIDEARIAGQLQHPGVPPVHDLGVLPDGRPFLVMKLIKGQTLEEAVDKRTSLDEDRGRFLAAFESLCQAVGYAHAHKVIHRDLKPANVMVGAFGEVQVMDWGLAKVLGLATVAPVDEDVAETEIRTLRESDGSETQAGSVFGTPAFMPPEQAIGAVNQVNRRSDVFGLGSILAYILTGEPPYTGKGDEAVRIQAARGSVEDCFRRLDRCGADPDLIALCKRCLSPDAEERPADAGEVAKEVAELRAAADERARLAEIDRVRLEGARAKAYAEARELRNRRRLQAILAASVGLLLLGGSLAGWWISRQREVAATKEIELERERSEREFETNQLAAQKTARDQVFGQAVREAVTDAESKLREGQPTAARASLEKAEGYLANGEGESHRESVIALRRDFEMLNKLDEAFVIRFNSAETNWSEFVNRNADLAYETAFRSYGLDVHQKSAQEVATALNARPIRRELVASLIDWLNIDPNKNVRQAEIVKLTDPLSDGPYADFKAAVVKKDLAALLTAINVLDFKSIPPNRILIAASFLETNGYAPESIVLLSKAHRVYPTDYFIALGLSSRLRDSGNPLSKNEALACARLAAAVRPDSASGWAAIARAANDLHQWDLEEVAAIRALAIRPDFSDACGHLGISLRVTKKYEEAEKHLQHAIQISPNTGWYYVELGHVYREQKRIPDAEKAYRKAIELAPNWPWPKIEVARIERDRRNFTSAETLYREVLKLTFDHDKKEASKELVQIFLDQGRHEDALAIYADAIRKLPGFDFARNGMKTSAAEQVAEKVKAGDKLPVWITAIQKITVEKPDNADARLLLGWLLHNNSQTDEAIRQFRNFMAVSPIGSWEINWALGRMYTDAGRLDEAIITWRDLVRANPQDYDAHLNYANALRYRCLYPEAIIAYQHAGKIESKTGGVNWKELLAFAYWGNGQLAEAVASWKEANSKTFPSKQAYILSGYAEMLESSLAGKFTPSKAEDLFELGRLCYFQKRYVTGVKYFEDALAKSPGLAGKFMANHYLTAAHAGLGHGVDAGDVAEQTRCRKQSLQWLKEWLDIQTKKADKGDGKVRISVRRDVRMVTDHPDLAGVREPGALAKLPAEERKAWQQFWAGCNEFLNGKSPGQP